MTARKCQAANRDRNRARPLISVRAKKRASRSYKRKALDEYPFLAPLASAAALSTDATGFVADAVAGADARLAAAAVARRAAAGLAACRALVSAACRGLSARETRNERRQNRQSQKVHGKSSQKLVWKHGNRSDAGYTAAISSAKRSRGRREVGCRAGDRLNCAAEAVQTAALRRSKTVAQGLHSPRRRTARA
jgi:hypothetical protein